MLRTGIGTAAALLPLACAATPVAAQSAEKSLGVVAGAAQYDLSGTGTAPFVALRFDIAPARFLLIEPGLTFLTYEPQFGARVRHWMPEVQAQAQVAGRVVRPYLGAGPGFSFVSRAGNSDTDLTLSAAAGVRLRATAPLTVRGELRIRAIDPWVGTTAEWGLGLSYRF